MDYIEETEREDEIYEPVKERIRLALGGLLTKKIYTYELYFKATEIRIFACEGRAYNISGVVLDEMLKQGFYFQCATLTNDGKPMLIFNTYKI